MQPAASALVPTRCELCPGINGIRLLLWIIERRHSNMASSIYYSSLSEKKSDDTFTLEYHIVVRVFCKSVKARPLGVF